MQTLTITCAGMAHQDAYYLPTIFDLKIDIYAPIITPGVIFIELSK